STISTAEFSNTSRASSALATVIAFMPLCLATSAQASRIVGSSSTMRMFMVAAGRKTAASSFMCGPRGSFCHHPVIILEHSYFHYRKHWILFTNQYIHQMELQ